MNATITTDSPTFAVGDWVIYRGSKARYRGWAMRVTAVYADHYSLRDDVWGVSLQGVRFTSVRPDPLGA